MKILLHICIFELWSYFLCGNFSLAIIPFIPPDDKVLICRSPVQPLVRKKFFFQHFSLNENIFFWFVFPYQYLKTVFVCLRFSDKNYIQTVIFDSHWLFVDQWLLFTGGYCRFDLHSCIHRDKVYISVVASVSKTDAPL